MKAIGVITFNFAPYNVTGTFRVLKFVKCMPDYGIQPIVITADQGNHHINEKLMNDVPENCKIYRLKSFFPDAQERYQKKTFLYSNRKKSLVKSFVRIIKDLFLSPDIQITWSLYHVLNISKIIKKEHIKTVLITGAPFSLFICGLLLKKMNGVKLILDYRDCWQKDLGQMAQSTVRQYLNKVYETLVLKNTDAVIATTQMILDLTTDGIRVPYKKVIPTGYDPQDFHKGKHETDRKSSTFTFFYSGKYLPGDQVYDPFMMINNLNRLSEEYTVKLIVCGHVDESVKKEHCLKYPFIDFKGFLSRTDLIRIAQESDAFIHFYYPNKLQDTISFKLFEYSQYNKPIISINTADSEVSSFLKSSRIGIFCENDDEEAVRDCFKKVILMDINGFQAGINKNEIEKYSIKNTSRELCDFIKLIDKG